MDSTTKILVVDDEKSIGQNVEKILKKGNYEVTQAVSAQEALEKMAQESYALLISDIVMPGQNGLELLKLVKKEWPLTKAVMMTAYASTDTAMKAIRLGALDYIPKPFTPDEMRKTVEKALSGELAETAVAPEERESIDVIDIDLPFEAREVAEQVGEEYMNMLSRSDMPIVEVKISKPLENFCEVGSMVCDIFKKLGATCKAGTKSGACPQKKAKKTEKQAARSKGDPKKLIGIDMPFDYEEVSAVTGPEYLRALDGEGVAFVPYEELKQNVARMMQKGRIDVDMPFDRDEVAAYTGDKYTEQLTRSDVPVVEITADQPLENFCEVGSMVCDIFKKLGATCKAGTKSGACPQKKAKKARGAVLTPARDLTRLISIDQPFDYEDVVAVTGTEFAGHLVHDETVMVPYEEVKANVARLDAEMAGRAAEQKKAAAKAEDLHVLVIDDEVAVNNNIRKILNKKGYRVEQATSKAEALEKIERRNYRLVLLDLKMPGVKGLELLEAIRNVQPQARVVIITGYASIETAVDTARMGAVDYVPKPFTPDEIRSATDNALRLAA
ncbi:MAG: response regulator [Desulfobacterales bacterium]